ncbi:MAG: 5-formyltetrahydrofolate cyclo-ligase [Candidatus Kaelpia aquatica]|nr:5-formyltetrahydrofolate cyclo-ligase [Candidatus Kaelpia aquatica]
MVLKVDRKDKIRDKMLSQLEGMDKKEKERRSLRIRERLFLNPKFQKANIIMSYVSKSYEVDTWTIIEKSLEMGKKIAVPYVLKGEKLMFPSLVLDCKELVRGPYEIYQPHPDNIRRVDLSRLDLLLVPGLAFDKAGNRLGHGEGYYDRFLKKTPYTYSLGLSYEFQVIDCLPISEFDRPVSSLIYA